MFQSKIFLIGLTALCSVIGSSNGEKIINCYWGTWSHYREDDGAFQVRHIKPNMCTHLSYTFEGIDNNGELLVLDTWLDLPDGLDNIAKVMALKETNPELKVLLVVGGWNEGSVKYSQMAADPAKRRKFVQSALKFIKKHKFDGLDLDWEYPAKRGGDSNDKANFVTLLKEIYQALNPEGYLFGIAVGASKEIAATSYQLPEIANYLDFINVMTYDFATWEGGIVDHNAPLRGPGSNNIDASIKHWLSAGVPAHKLVLGLAFYGHTFQVAGNGPLAIGSRANGAGRAGPHTKQPGYLGYHEICTQMDSYEYEWDEEASVPILKNANEVISYDNAESIALKVDYANSLNLGGVMIWSIETDDFLGRCGTDNILLKTVNNKMGKPQDMSASNNKLPANKHTKKPANKPAKKPAITNPNQPKQANNAIDSGNCSRDGTYPHQSDCSKFIHCADGVGYEKSCPSQLHFDASQRVCNWPEEAKCQ